MKKVLLRLIFAAIVASLAASPALAKKPIANPCGPARYVMPAGERLIAGEQPPRIDAVVLADGPTVGIAGGCPPAEAKVRRVGKTTRVQVTWRAGECAVLQAPVRLKARVDPACRVMRGKLRAKRFKQRFTAGRSECGDGIADAEGGEICDLRRVTPTLDASHAVATTVPPAGAVLTTTALDGTRYTLTVPPDAVVDPVEITMTPVTAISDLPFSGGLVGAVQFAPDGLDLLRPATLTIELLSPASRAGLTGFGYQGNGEALHLELIAAEQSTLTFAITHFSGFGAGIAVGNEIQSILSEPASGPETQAVNEIVGLIGQGVTDPQGYLNALRAWYAAFPPLVPTLDASGVRFALKFFIQNDQNLRRALRGYIRWRQTIATVSNFINFDYTIVLAPELQEAAQLTAGALLVAIARANTECLQNTALVLANDALRWQAVAEILGLVDSGIGLDRSSVVSGLCVQVRLIDVQPSDPAALRVGQSVNLHVTAGHGFGPGADRFDRPLLVTIDGAGVVPPGHTDAQGMYSETIVPSSSVLVVRACFDEPGLPHLSKACASRLLPTSSSTSTTQPSSSTTSTTLAGSGTVAPTNRDVVSSVQTTTLDKRENCCSNFFTTVTLPVPEQTTQVDDAGVFSGTAKAQVIRHDSTATVAGGGGLAQISDKGQAKGQLHTTVFSSPPTYGVGASGRAELQYEFQVNQQTAYHITASVTATAQATGANGDLKSLARVVLQRVPSGSEVFSLALSASAGVGGPQGGGTDSDDDSGGLSPGTYRLLTTADIHAFTAGALDQSQTGSADASYEVTLSFGP